MFQVYFKPTFVRRFKKLLPSLQEEVEARIKLFRNPRNHKFLRVHKLKGRFKGFHAFSVDFKHRIIFEYLSKNEVALLSIGDHEVYQ